jgi:uncharacterized NAD(P)/FAD-binding protein YdhS
MRYKIAIIGTGFSGTATLVHFVRGLVEQPHLANNLTLHSIERRPRNGSGFPYDSDGLIPAHLCNNPAEKMSLFDNDFVDWLGENRHFIGTKYPDLVQETHPDTDPENWHPSGDAFYPRALFGLYLEARFAQASQQAVKQGVDVQHLNSHEVVDGFSSGQHFTLKVRNVIDGSVRELANISRILLSSGHWQANPSAQYKARREIIASPYPHAVLLDRIRALTPATQTTNVYIAGMGPSAIDAVLSLTNNGRFQRNKAGFIISYQSSPEHSAFNITIASRSGYFPAVRQPQLDLQFHYLTDDVIESRRRGPEYTVSLDEVMQLVEKELRYATAGRYGWSNIALPRFNDAQEKLVYDIRQPEVNAIFQAVILRIRRLRFYRYLNGTDKHRYNTQIDTHFLRTAVPIPLTNALKLLALINAGTITAMRVSADAPPQSVQPSGYRIEGYRGTTPLTVEADAVVLAHGQDYSLARHPDSLLRNLLHRGELVPYDDNGYQPGGLEVDGQKSFRALRRCCGKETFNASKVTREDSAMLKSAAYEISPYLCVFGAPIRYWQNERNFAAAFVDAARWLTAHWIEDLENQDTTRRNELSDLATTNSLVSQSSNHQADETPHAIPRISRS